MSKPLLLDLFCGAGGAAKGYADAGFDVIGIDNKPQPNYPYEFVQADAMTILRDLVHSRVTNPLLGFDLADFDAIHASPPCQAFTAYRRRGDGVGDKYPDLVGPIRQLLTQTDVPWVIENVEGAPLQNPVRYCGSSFSLDVRRHRLFESSLGLAAPPCDHSWQTPRFPPASNRKNLRRTVEVGVWRIPLAVQQKAMGIDWMGLKELSNAVPPAYTAHIGAQLMKVVKEKV